MTLDAKLLEVNCPITGAKFSIVRKENPSSKKSFLDWADDILTRLDSGKTVNVSIDCEGFFLGSIKKSLSCIQIGEVFNDDFNVYQNLSPPSIGNKSGFIILTGFGKKIQKALSKILCHQNIMIYTFDFIGDFATLLEAGIKINMYRVFDSQMATLNTHSNINYIQNKNGKSLSWFVEEAEYCDPLGSVARVMKNKNKRNYFCVTSYLFKNAENPAKEILTKELLEMGAADVYMTALAAKYCILNNLSQKVLYNTAYKVNQFVHIVRNTNSCLGPSIYRRLFFIDTFSAWKYNNNLTLEDKTEEDLLNLLKIFQDMYSIISSYQILKLLNLSQVNYYHAQDIYFKVIGKLEKNRSRLTEMMNKYA